MAYSVPIYPILCIALHFEHNMVTARHKSPVIVITVRYNDVLTCSPEQMRFPTLSMLSL